MKTTKLHITGLFIPWWHHQMETFSALLAICAGKFPAQRPETRSFDAFFDLRTKKGSSKQSWGWWFDTPLRPFWRTNKVENVPWFEVDMTYVNPVKMNKNGGMVQARFLAPLTLRPHILFIKQLRCCYVVYFVIYTVFGGKYGSWFLI